MKFFIWQRCWSSRLLTFEMSSSLSGESWKLDRYARFVYSGTNECGHWKHYNDSSEQIVMTITNFQHLIITQSSVIFYQYLMEFNIQAILQTFLDKFFKESHSLVNAGSYIRGLSRNDSLLFMYKFKEETRRFRVRFCKDDTNSMSGEEVCIKAVKKLSAFFPIKTSVIENGATSSTQLNTEAKENHLNLAQLKISDMDMKSSTQYSEEVTLGAVAQAVLRGRSLPLAYHQHQHNVDIIPQLLIMCLGDPTFPAFVEAVETALKVIVDGSQ